MKIDTLVSDIYDVVSSPKSFNPDNVRSFSEALANRLSGRLSEERRSGTLRASNIGKPCDRQLWYEVHRHDDREPLPPAAKLKYLFGDILEELLLFLAREAGHDVQAEQAEIDVNGVKGHIDAVIDGRLVDVKSASSISFGKFKDHALGEDDPFGYLDQLGCYQYGSHALDAVKEKDVASFLVIDKNLGHITLDTYPANNKDYNKLVDEKREMLSCEEPPPRAFEDKPFLKSGNRKLDTTCSYCPFKNFCWKDSNEGKGLRTFIYSNGPVFLTKVVNEPKVFEVT